jgi:DNA invertase Pin-like site-specific DNA recombinase
MNAAIYARKSNEQKGYEDEAKSVTRQVDGARAFIKAKGWSLDERHVYQDDGKSGALFDGRPHFQRMLRDAEAGAFEAIVLFDLDRFGRDGKKSMEALYELTDLGITVWD